VRFLKCRKHKNPGQSESPTTTHSSTVETDFDVLFALDGTEHRDNLIAVDPTISYLMTTIKRRAASIPGKELRYSEATSIVVDALEARFKPLVDIQYARRNLEAPHSDHELSLDDLRTAFDDTDHRAAPGSIDLYNDVVLPLLSEFGRRLTAQIDADSKATREAARRRITECIVAHTDMHELSPTDVEFAVAEAKSELEQGGVW